MVLSNQTATPRLSREHRNPAKRLVTAHLYLAHGVSFLYPLFVPLVQLQCLCRLVVCTVQPYSYRLAANCPEPPVNVGAQSDTCGECACSLTPYHVPLAY